MFKMLNIVFLVTILIFAIEQVHGQGAACVATSDGKDIFENSPDGTVAISYNFTGVPGVDFTLSVTKELIGVFEFVGSDLVVANSSLLDRSKFPIPSGADGVYIEGEYICTDIGGTTGLSTDARVYMQFINKEVPTITTNNSVEQSEYAPVGTTVHTVGRAPTDEKFETNEYVIIDQRPPGFFEIDKLSGVITLSNNLDYKTSNMYKIDIELQNAGIDNTGAALIRTASQTLTINIEDYDNLPPIFQPCADGVCQPLYTLQINVDDATPDIVINPGAIKALDGDTGINATIKYSFVTGSPSDYWVYFEIDEGSGDVSLIKAVNATALYTIAVKAEQANNSVQFAVTYLQVEVTKKDDSEPIFEETSYSGSVLDDGSEIIFVYETGTNNLLKLSATDADDPDALIIYTLSSTSATSNYQISSEGNIFLRNTATTRSTLTELKVTAINVNADSSSPKRQSDPITVSIAVTEVTTQQTTEGTTEPMTTDGPTIESTTNPATDESTSSSISSTTPVTSDATSLSAASTSQSGSTPAPAATDSSEATTAVATSQVTSSPTASTSESVATSTTESASSETSTSSTTDDFTTTSKAIDTSTAILLTSSTAPSSVKMVEASTLYGVAGGLSFALFLAILVIVYLLWRYVYKQDKEDEKLISSENESSASGNMYQNVAYAEEDETKDFADDEPPSTFVTFTGNGQVTDLDVDDSPVTNLDDNINEETDSNAAFQENNVAYEGMPIADYDLDPMEEIEDQSPRTDFHDELALRAEQMVAAAAVSAAVAKSVESSPSEATARNPTQLSPDIVQEEEVIKEDVIGSTKIVTLKGYGDDGEDVKAVLKTIDTDMAMSTQIASTKAKIAVMETLSELDHPNILKFYGSYEKDGCLCYATKFAENGCLQDKIKNSKIDANTMMLIIANIGKGLQYLHANKITHGKLSTKSIMLDSENNPLLTDFENNSEVVTEFDEIMRWQALEVNNQTSGCTPASDVWSFGSIMWSMLSLGATPYENVPMIDLTRHMEQQPLLQPKGCSDSLFSVVTTCRNKDPKMRPDMYVINGNLSEKLLEDSNELICLDVDNSGGISNDDVYDELQEESDEFSPPTLSDSENYTAL